jgi:hypothetical protein
VPDFRAPITQNGVAVSLAGHTHSGGIASGTAFPDSPATNDLFFRTDYGFLCFYDGLRWLSPEYTATSTHYNVTGNIVFFSIFDVLRGIPIYISSVDTYFRVALTNNSSNYWVFSISSLGNGASYNVIGGHNTASYAPNTYYTRSGTLIRNTVDYYAALGSNITMIGAPGMLTAGFCVRYRYIIT